MGLLYICGEISERSVRDLAGFSFLGSFTVYVGGYANI